MRARPRSFGWRLLAAMFGAAVVAGLFPATTALAAPGDPTFKVLVFSKTAGFRHDSIPAGIAAIQQLGAGQRLHGRRHRGRHRVHRRQPGPVRRGGLAVHHRRRARRRPAGRLRALHPRRRRLRRRPRRVRHRVRLALVRPAGRRVLHAAPGEPAGDRQGRGPGAPVHGGPAGRGGRGSTSGTTSRPTRAARCTCWPALDEQTYTPGTGAMGADHPIAWCQDYDGGRSWYTGLRPHHRVATAEPALPAPTCSAASRPRPARSRPTAARRRTSSFEKVTLDSNTQQPDGAGRRPGRPGVLHRARRPGADHQARPPAPR